MRKDDLYWIWMSLRYGAGNGTFTEVLESFRDPYAAYVADEALLRSRLGERSMHLARLREKDLAEAHRIYDFCQSHGVSILTYGDIAYPARLKTIQDPPILLYYVGTLPALNRKLCIGVVGTRKISEYGKRIAYKISYELASANAVVVSGMALGCDAVAAAGAITAGGQTVAVLGSGIDVVYPRQHLALMQHIRENGAVMTEYPPGSPPLRHHFPLRNRIISGLSQGTLAVEGSLKSGALLTVGYAVKQGRRVFAVPGNVGEANAEGTNELIRNGATVALDAGDILECFEVTDSETIDLDGYRRAIAHSTLDEGALFRLGISSRLGERDAEGAYDVSTQELPAVERKKKPADLLGTHKTDAEKKPSKKRSTEPVGKKRQAAAPAEVTAEKHETAQGDGSEQILASLSERDRRIFCEMPSDRAIPIDKLTGLGYSIGDIMTGMTILEIQGLVTSLPGGLYLKK